MSLKIIVAIGAVSLGAFAAPSIGWQPEPAAPAAAHAADRVTPEAKAVLDRMRAHFNTLKGVSVKATTTTSMSIDGDEHKNEWTCSLRAARPNLVSSRVVTGGDTSPQQVTNCDGKTETIYLGVPMNMYETSDAPGVPAPCVRGRFVRRPGLSRNPAHDPRSPRDHADGRGGVRAPSPMMRSESSWSGASSSTGRRTTGCASPALTSAPISGCAPRGTRGWTASFPI